jgi:hypothetical protein
VSIKVVDLEHPASELEALQVLGIFPVAAYHVTCMSNKSMDAQGTHSFVCEGNSIEIPWILSHISVTHAPSC